MTAKPTNDDYCSVQHPYVLWFTGLSGAGKTTIATAIGEKLSAQKKHVYNLDGDKLRNGLCKDLGFSDKDREENIRRAAEVTKMMFEAGTIVICSFISPFIKERKLVRDLIPADRFAEIYVNTPLAICQQRDPKGLYAKVKAGLITNFTGISSPYEEPINPEIIIAAGTNNLDVSVKQVMQFINKNFDASIPLIYQI